MSDLFFWQATENHHFTELILHAINPLCKSKNTPTLTLPNNRIQGEKESSDHLKIYNLKPKPKIIRKHS